MSNSIPDKSSGLQRNMDFFLGIMHEKGCPQNQINTIESNKYEAVGIILRQCEKLARAQCFTNEKDRTEMTTEIINEAISKLMDFIPNNAPSKDN